jgi:DUF4097 and DUF4098 domain-containing protein YvlB
MKPAVSWLMVALALALAMPGCVLPEPEEPTGTAQEEGMDSTAEAQAAGETSASSATEPPPEPAQEAADPVFTGAVESDETTSGACTNGPLAPFCAERRIVVSGIAKDLPLLPTLVQTFSGGIEIAAVEGDDWRLEAVLTATGLTQDQAEEGANAIGFEWSTRAEDASYALTAIARPSTPVPLSSQSADLRLVFPRDVALALRASTSAGPIVVAGLVRGSVDVETGSGSIDLEALDVGDVLASTSSGTVSFETIAADVLEIGTGSGGILGTAVDAKEIKVSTSSGGISLSGLKADLLSADTGSGGVDVEDAVVVATNISVSAGSIAFAGAGRDLGIETGSGSVSATFDPTATGNIDVNSGSGMIDLEIPEDAEHGYQITASTSSGTRQIGLEDGEQTAADATTTFVTSGFDQRSIQTTVLLETGSGSISVNPTDA